MVCLLFQVILDYKLTVSLSSPGRFFAVTEMKTILAHILVSYDIKLENEGVRPSNQWFAGFVVPNQNAEIVLRTRQY